MNVSECSSSFKRSRCDLDEQAIRGSNKLTQEGSNNIDLNCSVSHDPSAPMQKKTRISPHSTFYRNDTLFGDSLDSEDIAPCTPYRGGVSYGSTELYDNNSFEPVDFFNDQGRQTSSSHAFDNMQRNPSSFPYYNEQFSYVTPSRHRSPYNMTSRESMPLDIFEKMPNTVSPYNSSVGFGGSYQNDLLENSYAPHNACHLPSLQPTNSYKENQDQSAQFYGPSESPVSLCSTVSANQPAFAAAAAAAAIGCPLQTSNRKSQNGRKRFKAFHEEKWNDHLNELLQFKEKYGHCLVPHTFPENQNLARWVKRQRRQYKLMKEGNESSTMTQERANILNKEGFIWDSHEIVWRERYNQLLEYKKKHGHCRVPSYCKENPQLASWVKCQRRQYKLFWEGKRSSMSVERTQLLENIGFTWEVRPELKQQRKQDSLRKLAEVLHGL